jgi:hypothetical protein
LSGFCVKKTFLFSIFLFSGVLLYAEQSVEAVQSFEKIEILQRISWPPEQDALKYELVIEKKDETSSEGAFIPVADISTEETSVEISLEAGEYRYRVIVYDLLRRQRPVPEWSRLIVLEALRPEISAVEPPSVSLTDNLADLTLNLKGNNFTENAEVYFLYVDGGTDTDGKPVAVGNDDFRPAGDGKSARLNLKDLPLKKGLYDIVIKNPGGMYATWRNFKITDGAENTTMPRNQKPPVFEAIGAVGYALMIPVSGQFNEFVKNTAFPAGVMARLGGKTMEKSFGAFGLEAGTYWHYIIASNDAPVKSGYIFNILLDLLYQKKLFNQKAAFNARLGGGLAHFYGFKFKSVPFVKLTGNNTVVPMFGSSLSGSYFFYKKSFFDLGAEYVCIFPDDEPPLSYIRCVFCIGFEF